MLWKFQICYIQKAFIHQFEELVIATVSSLSLAISLCILNEVGEDIKKEIIDLSTAK